MKEEIKFQPYPPARAGIVHQCAYCGEDAGNGKFCKTCKTQKGRQEVLKQNIEILKVLREKGYCKNEILLPVA